MWFTRKLERKTLNWYIFWLSKDAFDGRTKSILNHFCNYFLFFIYCITCVDCNWNSVLLWGLFIFQYIKKELCCLENIWQSTESTYCAKHRQLFLPFCVWKQQGPLSLSCVWLCLYGLWSTRADRIFNKLALALRFIVWDAEGPAEATFALPASSLSSVHFS